MGGIRDGVVVGGRCDVRAVGRRWGPAGKASSTTTRPPLSMVRDWGFYFPHVVFRERCYRTVYRKTNNPPTKHVNI